MAKGKRNLGRLQVFKGREAKLNRAIFHIIALKSPLPKYGIHKIVKTRRRLRHVRYATVNKRVRALQESGCIKKTGSKKTKAGFKASIYELTTRAYLAILLNSINLNKLVTQADEATASAILAIITHHKITSIIARYLCDQSSGLSLLGDSPRISPFVSTPSPSTVLFA